MSKYRKGERIFNLVYPFLMVLYFPLFILPRFISEILWELCRYIPRYIGIGIRYVLLKKLAKKCGKNVAISDSVHFIVGKSLIIGSHISIMYDTYIDGDYLVIGDNFMMAHGSSIITGAHVYNPEIPMRDTLEARPVKIGSNVWMGTGAKIIGEVSVGDNVIIGANTVVTKPIPSNVVVAGVTAKIIKSLDKDNI